MAVSLLVCSRMAERFWKDATTAFFFRKVLHSPRKKKASCTKATAEWVKLAQHRERKFWPDLHRRAAPKADSESGLCQQSGYWYKRCLSLKGAVKCLPSTRQCSPVSKSDDLNHNSGSWFEPMFLRYFHIVGHVANKTEVRQHLYQHLAPVVLFSLADKCV